MAFGKNRLHEVPAGLAERLASQFAWARALTNPSAADPEPGASPDSVEAARAADPVRELPSRDEWARISKQAREAAAHAVREFFRSAHIVAHGTITGSIGMLTPGSIRDNGGFESSMAAHMAANAVPEAIAGAWAAAIAENWSAWFSGYRILLDFPHLEGGGDVRQRAEANLEVPISDGKSSGEFRMSAVGIWTTLRRKLGSRLEEPGAAEAVEQFVLWMSKCFIEWKDSAAIANVMGSTTAMSAHAAPAKSTQSLVVGLMTSEPGFLSDLGVFGG